MNNYPNSVFPLNPDLEVPTLTDEAILKWKLLEYEFEGWLYGVTSRAFVATPVNDAYPIPNDFAPMPASE